MTPRVSAQRSTPSSPPAFLCRTTHKSVEEIAREFPEVIQRRGLVYVGRHDMKDFLIRHGHLLHDDYMVFEFSNPDMLKGALENMPDCLCFSPARIAVYRKGGTTHLSAFSSMFFFQNMRMPAPLRRQTLEGCRAFDLRLASILDELCAVRRPARADK